MDADDRSARVPDQRRRVLVVDDDPDVREVAQTALELVGGWQVWSAAGGRIAMELARHELPDAILLDVMMPDLDGPATVRHLRNDPATAQIPVILLTAKSQSDGLSGWEEIGLAGVIGKPFDPMTLPDQISRLLGWAR